MYTDKQALVLLRGGGDLATGVALRLHRAGIRVVITELAQPLTVRRTVSFAETVYEGSYMVEGVPARLVRPNGLSAVLEAGEIPVLVDPEADILTDDSYAFICVIDGRLIKTPPPPLPVPVPLHIGLGPGFHAGVNCHAAIETRRSHTLGRVYWNGATQADSGQPDGDPRRVLRAPVEGILIGHKKIGEHCESGDLIAEIQSQVENRKHLHRTHTCHLPRTERLCGVRGRRQGVQVSEIRSPFKGVLRGLIHDDIHVTKGLKIGDIDLHDDPSACFLVSDKALAIGGAVLEAILTREEIRQKLWK